LITLEFAMGWYPLEMESPRGQFFVKKNDKKRKAKEVNGDSAVHA